MLETESAAVRVLVADDRADVLEALRLLLKGAGHQIETADSPQALLRAVERSEFDAILMDLNYARDTTSGQEGLDLLDMLHAREVAAPVIVMTAWGNVDLAVEAMRRGACDFIQKPWDNARLLTTVEKQARQGADRRKAERRARSELEIAAKVQQRLFPQSRRNLAGVDYGGRCVPAREVGGDYYDFLELGTGRLAFLLADVAGKGIAAALLMANLQGCIRSHIENAAAPRLLLHGVNRLFYESTPAEQYATLFYGEYDPLTRRLRYVNCGHHSPVLARCDGGLERLGPTATVLGAFRDWTCEESSAVLAPGDTLVVFSDGVTEAGIDSGEDFGEERLIAAMASNRGAPIDRLTGAIVDAALHYGAGVQSDDITVVGLRAL
jgi:sigma-B regulation protein RsbU (phosphoserine phosphatase)